MVNEFTNQKVWSYLILNGMCAYRRNKVDEPYGKNPQSVSSFFKAKKLKMNQHMLSMHFLWHLLYLDWKKDQGEWGNVAENHKILCSLFSGSSRPLVFCKKGVLSNFTGNHGCQSLFFKVAGLTPATLLKKRLWHGCFLVNFEKFLGKPFLTEHLPRLLLQVFTKLFTAWRFHKFDIVRQRTTNKLSWEGKIPSKYVWHSVIFLKQELPLIRKSNYLSLIQTLL